MAIYHIYPLFDLKEHEMDDAGNCWCAPEEDADQYGLYIIHNSMDGREDYESHRRKLS